MAQPVAGIENDSFCPLIETTYVDALPELYMATTTLPSVFLKATASPPLVPTTVAPGWTYCER